MAQKENIFLELFAYTVNGSKKENALRPKRKTFFWSCLHILLMAQKKCPMAQKENVFLELLLLMAQKRKMPSGPKGKRFSGVVCIYC